MNQWLFLAPIGMILIGFGFIFYWHKLHKTKFIIFAWGGLLWFIAMVLKSLMDGTIMSPFIDWVNSVLPSMVIFIVSVIVGLRTGFFESGISYLMLKKRVSKFKWHESVGLGIGFGASEAIVLGVITLISMLMISSPEFLMSLSDDERLIIETQLSLSSWSIFAPWIERFFTVFAHTFATVLVIKGIQLKNINYIWVSIAYKSILDLLFLIFS